ncbi:MAG: hypothetical protein NVS4B7_19730 [Ktedonobacteraceae bacterium]
MLFVHPTRSSGFISAFLFGGVVCLAFALIGFIAREQKSISATALEPIAPLEKALE